MEQAGLETRAIGLADKDIRYCDGCFACTSGACVHDDDMEPILDAMRWCDGLLLASPVYMGLVTGQMKTIADGPRFSHSGAAIVGKTAEDEIGLQTIRNLADKIIKTLGKTG